jgi:hypothetical protein
VFSSRQTLVRQLQQDGIKVPEKFFIARYAQVYGEGESVYELWVPVESLEMRAAPLITAVMPGATPKIDLDFLKDVQ